ncbi:MAG: hypothetical protein U1F53_02740 [Burkholderiaceae bacterium]
MDRRHEAPPRLDDHRGAEGDNDEHDGLAVMDAIVCQLTGASEAVIAQAHAQAASRAAASARAFTQSWD